MAQILRHIKHVKDAQTPRAINPRFRPSNLQPAWYCLLAAFIYHFYGSGSVMYLIIAGEHPNRLASKVSKIRFHWNYGL